jgi:hypothetical protein
MATALFLTITGEKLQNPVKGYRELIMSDIIEYGLTEVPFPLFPDNKVVHWAGMEDLRKEVVDVVESVRESDTGLSEFAVLHGSYGAGKSHALRYLRSLINSNVESFHSRAVYVQSIRIEDKISFLALYKEIIRELGDDYILQIAASVNEYLDTLESEVPNALTLQREGKLREEVLQGFDRELVPMLRLLGEISSGDDQALRNMRDGVKSDFDAAKRLGAFFGCMRACRKDGKPLAEAAYIFIDEVEATTEVKVNESQAFFNALLQLINQLPYNLCIICSFTGDTALLEAVVPEALLQRLTRAYIELPELDGAEAKEFISKHLEMYRPQGFASANRFHPFQEDAVDYVLARTLPMTPRNIFRGLRKVLERSIKREHLNPGEEIDRDAAARVLG